MCGNCEVLRATVARLERELSLRHADGEIAAIMRGLDLSTSAARVVAALYAAKGRVVRTEYLVENANLASESVLRTMVSRARDAMSSKGAITALYGIGYQLEPAGMAAVLAAVQPPEIQDVRAA